MRHIYTHTCKHAIILIPRDVAEPVIVKKNHCSTKSLINKIDLIKTHTPPHSHTKARTQHNKTQWNNSSPQVRKARQSAATETDKQTARRTASETEISASSSEGFSGLFPSRLFYFFPLTFSIPFFLLSSSFVPARVPFRRSSPSLSLFFIPDFFSLSPLRDSQTGNE